MLTDRARFDEPPAAPLPDLTKVVERLMDEREKLTQIVKATTPLDSLDDLDALKVYYVNLVRSQEVRRPPLQPVEPTVRCTLSCQAGFRPSCPPARAATDCQVGSRPPTAGRDR